MLKREILALTATGLLSTAYPAAAFDGFDIVGGGQYWHASPGGAISITRGGESGSGSTIDVSRDLGLGAQETAAGDVGAAVGKHRFRLGYEPMGFGGDAALRRPIVFHGATYPAGERVRTDLALRFWTLAYDYELRPWPETELRGGLEPVVWTFDAELRGMGPGGALDETRRFTHVLPALTLEGHRDFGRWFVAASGAGGLIAGDRYEADLRGGGGLHAGDHIDLYAGYRWMKFRFHETTNRGDLDFRGPLVELALRF